MLLIEFEAEQSFSLQGKLTMSRDVQVFSLFPTNLKQRDGLLLGGGPYGKTSALDTTFS